MLCQPSADERFVIKTRVVTAAYNFNAYTGGAYGLACTKHKTNYVFDHFSVCMHEFSKKYENELNHRYSLEFRGLTNRTCWVIILSYNKDGILSLAKGIYL